MLARGRKDSGLDLDRLIVRTVGDGVGVVCDMV